MLIVGLKKNMGQKERSAALAQDLLQAASHGRAPYLSWALSEGANVDARDEHEWTAAMLASAGGHEAALQTLIDAGADLAAREHHGSTALMLAANDGHAGCVKILLDSGRRVDLSATDPDGADSLMIAADCGHGACVDMLVSAGSDVLARDKQGQSAADRAREGGYDALAARLEALMLSRTEADALDQATGAAPAASRIRI